MPSSRIVRQSKYRHVFGTPAKAELQYTTLKPSLSTWDSDKLTANKKYIAVPWDAIGGGSFAVIKADNPGKQSTSDLLMGQGHTATVLDLKFNPFNDNVIASASEDCKAKVWSVNEDGVSETQSLSGHKRKVGSVSWHPHAEGTLVTTSTDYTVKLWDVESGAAKINNAGFHTNIIQSVTWNFDGTNYATSSKDKELRVIDPRTNQVVQNTKAHDGVKGFKAVYLGRTGKLASIGFTRTSQRQMHIWDPKDMSKPVSTVSIDTSGAMLMPFFDDDCQILYLAGRGDSNVRYYEADDEAPHIFFLDEYKSSTSQRGMAWLPKTALDVAGCEIARMLKLTNNSIEPVSFKVPRKSDMFQDDLYPPTHGGAAGLGASAWFDGENGLRATVDMESLCNSS